MNLIELLGNQVYRVVHQEGVEEIKPLLEKGVSVMKSYQDLLGQDTWLDILKVTEHCLLHDDANFKLELERVKVRPNHENYTKNLFNAVMR